MPAGARVPGHLDPTFAAGGVLVRALPGDDDAFDSVVVQPDGHVLVSGADGLHRLDAAGVPDPGFTPSAVSGQVVLQPDGRIVVLGRDRLTRLRADGSLDTGFGQGGVAALVSAFNAAASEARAPARQPNGKLVVGGVIGNQVALARWDSRGDLDRGFGDDGLVITPVASAGSRVEAVAATPDNGVVVAGIARIEQQIGTVRFLVARYLADGRLDPSFGSGGVVTTDLGGAAWATSVVQLADGGVVVGGVDRGAAGDVLVAGYRADGSLDPGFGRAGIAAMHLGDVDPAAALALAVGAGGAIVAAHTRGGPDACGVALLRYRTSGTLDPGFGVGGIARDDSGSCDRTLAMALAPDGRIVTAGVRKGTRTHRAIVERWLAGTCGDGLRDPEEDCDGGPCPPSCCLADADGDGWCDAVDPCTVPLAVDRVRLVARRARGGRLLGGKLRVSGTVAFADSPDPPPDPAAQGLRVIVGDTLDVTIPAGTYDPTTRSGWIAESRSATSRQWTYRDGTGLASDGVSRVVLREAAGDGTRTLRLELRAGAGRWNDVTAASPGTATLVFAPDRAPRRQCGVVTFADLPDTASCRIRRSGAGISCR